MFGAAESFSVSLAQCPIQTLDTAKAGSRTRTELTGNTLTLIKIGLSSENQVTLPHTVRDN